MKPNDWLADRRAPYLVGLISDTHGLMRAQALDALLGSKLILHAGDIGDAAVLKSLAAIAPVRAVRGNNDKGKWVANIPATDALAIGAHSIYLLHNLAELDLDPIAAGFTVIVYGHSHRPLVEQREGILFVNPGSAGPRRFSLPVTVARLSICGRRCEAKLIQLL